MAVLESYFEYTICMLRNAYRWTVRCVLGITLAFFSVPTISLAASLPAARDVAVVPGATAEVEIPITNSGTADNVFSLLLLSASFQTGIEQPQLEELSSNIGAWISLSSPSISVPSQTSVPITLTVHPPINFMPQTLIVAVVAAEKLDGEITLVHGAATLVFVSVGDVAPQGACESFLQDASGAAQLSLSNSGRGILYDNGEIILRGMFGMRLGSASSNPSFHRVPSGQTRTWQVSLPTIPWWAMGPLSYSIDDAQLREHPCDEIDAGARWLPLFGVGIGFLGIVI